MFREALITITNTWKQSKCPSTGYWIRKMWYVYPMECYSAIKKHEIMLLATMQIDLEIVILS